MMTLLSSLTLSSDGLLQLGEVGPGLILLIYCVGLALVLLEVMIPGMLIGLIGGGAVITAIYLAFKDGNTPLAIGLIGLVVVVVPAALMLTLRKITHQDEMTTEAGYLSVDIKLGELVGQQGKTLTPLRPGGRAQIGQKKVDVVSQSAFIADGRPIEVVEVEGYRVTVRELPGVQPADGA